MKIGIFDSGLGGLTVVQRVRERLPQADIVYFADQAHLPYGERSATELHRLLQTNLRTLEDLDVDVIVMGCNTSCAVGRRLGWPRLRVPLFDLIEAGANMAFAACHFSVAVLATTATVESGVYREAIQRRHAAVMVEEVAAPGLVPLIESGATTAELLAALHEILSRFQQNSTGLILGCSHYSIIGNLFAQLLPTASILDPSIAQADTVAAFARQNGLEQAGRSTIHAWTNADPQAFERAVRDLGFDLPGMSFGHPANGLLL